MPVSFHKETRCEDCIAAQTRGINMSKIAPLFLGKKVDKLPLGFTRRGKLKFANICPFYAPVLTLSPCQYPTYCCAKEESSETKSLPPPPPSPQHDVIEFFASPFAAPSPKYTSTLPDYNTQYSPNKTSSSPSPSTSPILAIIIIVATIISFYLVYWLWRRTQQPTQWTGRGY